MRGDIIVIIRNQSPSLHDRMLAFVHFTDIVPFWERLTILLFQRADFFNNVKVRSTLGRSIWSNFRLVRRTVELKRNVMALVQLFRSDKSGALSESFHGYTEETAHGTSSTKFQGSIQVLLSLIRWKTTYRPCQSSTVGSWETFNHDTWSMIADVLWNELTVTRLKFPGPITKERT